jgi:putative ABC transport system permease protein
LLVVSFGLWAAITTTLDELFDTVFHYELDVAFIGPAGKNLADAVSVLPGVEAVNHTCVTVVRARSLQAETSLTLMGLQRGQTALVMPKVGGGLVAIEPGDFWLPRETARRLHVEAGDPLYLEWAFSSRQKRVRTVVPVRGLLDIDLGGVIYGEYSDVRRRMGDRIYPESGYGAQIQCSRATGEALQRRFERSDLTASVTSIGEIRDQIRQSLKITLLFVGILVVFSSTLAGAVLHSVSSMGILERLRELATLRSLGFSARQTAWIAAVEVYSMATLGLILGLPLGIWMNAKFLAVYNTETFNFQPSLPPWIFLATGAIVYGLVAISLYTGLTRLRTMDLAQATKARE